MKKTKTSRKKTNNKKKISQSTASSQKQVRVQKDTAPEKVNRQTGPAKKDAHKKIENGTSGPKKYFSIVRQFLVDSKMELKKVTWPTKKELLSVTAVVIVLVIFIAFFLGLVDFGLVKIIKNIVG
jgi:preprotein translocase subunit SecE